MNCDRDGSLDVTRPCCKHITAVVKDATPTFTVKLDLHYYALYTRTWELMMNLISTYKTCWLLIVIGITPASTTCKSVVTIPPAYDKACKYFGHINISTTTEYHCSLSCIQESICYATIYDATRHNCMLLDGCCLLLQPFPGHVYQTLKHECVKWVPHSGDDDVYWLYDGDSMRKNFIARSVHDGDHIVGKEIEGTFHGVSRDGDYVTKGSSYERLVVYPSCHATWVGHDYSTGEPLPTGVLIGGILTSKNTPLYVVKLVSGSKSFSGYFNPLNDLAWGEIIGVKSRQYFEVLVTLPW